jgi:hypothetical protein
VFKRVLSPPDAVTTISSSSDPASSSAAGAASCAKAPLDNEAKPIAMTDACFVKTDLRIKPPKNYFIG